MSTFYMRQNDTQPRLLATLQDGDANPINLTGASVQFHMRTLAGSLVTNRAAVIVTAASGDVRYDWIAADTATVGSYQAEFQVTYSDGTIETFPNSGYIRVEISDDIA
jgi:hypothetical protein